MLSPVLILPLLCPAITMEILPLCVLGYVENVKKSYKQFVLLCSYVIYLHAKLQFNLANMNYNAVGADKCLARPGRKHADVSVRTARISFGDLPCRKRKLMTARVSMLLKSRAFLTYFRACFRPGRAKDLSASITRSGQTLNRNIFVLFKNSVRTAL